MITEDNYHDYFDGNSVMEHGVLNETRLKEDFKSALIEVIEERKNLISELLAEAIEDIGLIRAIKESESIESASREEIFSILEGNA